MSHDHLFKESQVIDKIMLHPSDTVNIKHSIMKELNKKLMKWDDQVRGVFVSFQNVQILNGGKGRIMDDFAWIQYNVRFTVTYAQPKIDDRIYGTVKDIQLGHMTLSVYNILTVIVNLESLDSKRFQIQNTASAILSDIESNAEDDFDIEDQKSKIEISDKQNGTTHKVDSIVEIQITKLSISQGNVILFGQLV
eukprot:403335132